MTAELDRAGERETVVSECDVTAGKVGGELACEGHPTAVPTVGLQPEDALVLSTVLRAFLETLPLPFP